MYITKIKQPTDTWIVSICQIEEDATTYLATLPASVQADAVLFEIPFEYFPFILIQNTDLPHDSESYFEYCEFETLQARIENTRAQKVDSEDHSYFNYYYISEPYEQRVKEENYMKYLHHTSVTNDVLNEPYPITLFHEEIKKNADNYDLDRMDQLFEHTKTKFTSAIEKEDLALNGYDSLFWDMNYDHACGKLTDEGIELLLPMVEKMELLLGEKKWEHRAFAQHILLEHACKEHPQTAFAILEETIKAFNNYIISNPEETLEIHRLVSLAYRWMMEVDPNNAFYYWELALAEIKSAIDFSPEKASWSSLFELLYISYEDVKITETQIDAQNSIQEKIEVLEKQLGAAISYPIAFAYQQLREYFKWNKLENVFPESLALRWAEKSLAYNPIETTRIDLHESAEFFNKIGLQTNRIDFLVKTISIYERIIKGVDDYTSEIYCIIKIWKQIADINIKNIEYPLADKAIEQAQAIYNKHIELVKRNRSIYMHYAAFLEFCYNYDGNITKPTLAELKQIMKEVEIESEGFYSSPYVSLMHIALYESDEKQAILECTKSLILHELCADNTFIELSEEFESSSFNELKHFLHETKLFMEEVNENYYYNPDVKWKQLRTMTSEEIRAYWKKRKEEIRNRPPLVTE